MGYLGNFVNKVGKFVYLKRYSITLSQKCSAVNLGIFKPHDAILDQVSEFSKKQIKKVK